MCDLQSIDLLQGQEVQVEGSAVTLPVSTLTANISTVEATYSHPKDWPWGTTHVVVRPLTVLSQLNSMINMAATVTCSIS